MQWCAVDLRQPLATPGWMYVALSRVASPDHLMLLVAADTTEQRQPVFTDRSLVGLMRAKGMV